MQRTFTDERCFDFEFWVYSTREWVREFIGLEDIIALIILGLGVAGNIDGCIPYIPWLTDFYRKISTELIGIGVTVLIIDNINQARIINEEKMRLIIQLRSPNNTFAIEAARQLEERNWLNDGTLTGAFLDGANLSGAPLYNAWMDKAAYHGPILKMQDCPYLI